MSISLWWKQLKCKHPDVETYPFTVYTHHYDRGRVYAVSTKEYIVTACRVCGAVKKSKI